MFAVSERMKEDKEDVLTYFLVYKMKNSVLKYIKNNVWREKKHIQLEKMVI
jgi:hypothetical protein